VAQVAAPEAQAVALVRSAAGGRAALLEIALLASEPPEGRVLELWLLPAGRPPVSLGLLPASGRLAVPLGPALASGLPGAMLAISDEPAGGSPTGLPGGRLRATVPLTPL
jgi:anti-sigma-K factor RskA